MSLKKIFLTEVNAEIKNHNPSANEAITEEDILPLPPPVQKYFRHCGFLGKPKMVNAVIEWEDVFLKFSFNKDWRKITCYQFNSVPLPARIVFMESKIAGIFPFEGRDKYQEGHGNMLIKLLKIFTVGDSKGKEMDESALVTVLAEALIIPTYALQPYIRWESIDNHSARAIIKNDRTEVSGIFYFNDYGENIKFETEDRNFTDKRGGYRKIKWSTRVENYRQLNGLKVPTTVSACWHLPSGDFEYYKGKIANLDFNIREPIFVLKTPR